MKCLLASIVLAGVLMQDAWSGTVVQGPPLRAEDLARQLGVFAQTLTYEQKEIFGSLSFRLSYKERNADGTYTVKKDFAASTHKLDVPTKKISITVMLDANKSMVILPTSSSSSKGDSEIAGSLYSTYTPPRRIADGEYVLLTISKDPSKSDLPENIKGILVLDLAAVE